MGRRQKLKTKMDSESDEEEAKRLAMEPSSSDDEEANEDLSLKLVQKAMLRYSKRKKLDDSDSDYDFDEFGHSASASRFHWSTYPEERDSGSSEEQKNKISNGDKPEAIQQSVNGHKEEVEREIDEAVDMVDTMKSEKTADVANKEEVDQLDAADIVNFVEPDSLGMSDNLILRQLLRGPRYFDPQDSSWGTCYNCGEEGHTAVLCTSVKRRKPCFVCGSSDHNSKNCTKGQDCFICKKQGHRAKDCPDKSKSYSLSSSFCLKCGGSGHDLFSCKNDYSHDDLKQIRCYVCKSFGHLCCIDSAASHPKKVSCYRCGQLGHTGLACRRVCAESLGMGSTSSCFKCGEKGHFARECTNSVQWEAIHSESPDLCYKCGEEGHFARECKVRRSRELFTPTERRSKKDRSYLGFKSAPEDLGKACKRKKSHKDEKENSVFKRKHRGGWITEDPGDLPIIKATPIAWRSPSTPSSKSYKNRSLGADGHLSSSRTSKPTRKLYFGCSEGSTKTSKHRFTASRFGNSGSTMRMSNDW
ncbi:Zinc finger, CCHC-type [Dillenia turbinata]|uniref:Zinc finger, CCHC-type n=1 Tax=Dillenia turbinata TaxID=194707 RepID=A0AAN8ZAJ3_9MAGN